MRIWQSLRRPHADHPVALRTGRAGASALEYLGNFGRTVAERILPGRRLAMKVVYNLSTRAGDERVVVTVELGRPTHQAEPEGDEQ